MFAALFIVACGGSAHSPPEIPSLQATDATAPADKEVGLAGPGSGGDGGGGPLGGRDWPEPGEDAGPLEPQSLVDTGVPEALGPWGPVLWQLTVPDPGGGGGTTTVNRLSSSDPFTATYQLEDGTILVTNEDISQGIPNADDEIDPPVIEWTDPESEVLNIFDGEIIVYFLEIATQQDLEALITAHNLHVIMSWFEPPDEGLLGNALAWFHFEYDQEEFPTFDDAFTYFSVHPLVDQALPAQVDTWENDYASVSRPNDYYYAPVGRENRYVSVLGVDSTPRVSLGMSYGINHSHQVVAVLDDGVWRNHPEFWVNGGIYNNWGKVSWVGANVYRRSYRVGYHYGGPNVWNPERRTLVTHGTAVAGMLTATTHDTRGVAALAPRHIILPIRMKGRYSVSKHNMQYSEDVWVKSVRALRFKFAHDQWVEDVRVVNMSFGGKRFPHWWASKNFKKNLSRDLKRNDRLYVGAAGNEYLNARKYPAAFDNVLGVSGLFTNRFGVQWYHWYSSTAGWASNYRNDGYATYPISGICDFTESYWQPRPWWVGRTLSIGDFPWKHNTQWYGPFNGTSAATPCVAGLAAALYQARPWVKYNQVWNRIVSTRDDSKARGYIAGLVDYDAALTGW
ncbi:S8/S53 family peptidase [bacterium]|nr:S8/S53 family peptidase [bacterium]